MLICCRSGLVMLKEHHLVSMREQRLKGLPEGAGCGSQ